MSHVKILEGDKVGYYIQRGNQFLSLRGTLTSQEYLKKIFLTKKEADQEAERIMDLVKSSVPVRTKKTIVPSHIVRYYS